MGDDRADPPRKEPDIYPPPPIPEPPRFDGDRIADTDGRDGPRGPEAEADKKAISRLQQLLGAFSEASADPQFLTADLVMAEDVKKNWVVPKRHLKRLCGQLSSHFRHVRHP